MCDRISRASKKKKKQEIIGRRPKKETRKRGAGKKLVKGGPGNKGRK